MIHTFILLSLKKQISLFGPKHGTDFKLRREVCQSQFELHYISLRTPGDIYSGFSCNRNRCSVAFKVQPRCVLTRTKWFCDLSRWKLPHKETSSFNSSVDSQKRSRVTFILVTGLFLLAVTEQAANLAVLFAARPVDLDKGGILRVCFGPPPPLLCKSKPSVAWDGQRCGVLKPGNSWSQQSVHHFTCGLQDEQLDSSRDPGAAASPRSL